MSERSDEPQYWFNVRTGQVDEGHQRASKELLGPYATREQAQQALTTAAARTEAWDREDAEQE